LVYPNQNVDVALRSLRQGAQKVQIHSLHGGTCVILEHLRSGMMLGGGACSGCTARRS
jgi:hypothetical protein